MSSTISDVAAENGTHRRRSTFYVSLASDCVKTHSTSSNKCEARRTLSATSRKSSISNQSPIKNSAVVAETKKTPSKLPYKRLSSTMGIGRESSSKTPSRISSTKPSLEIAEKDSVLSTPMIENNNKSVDCASQSTKTRSPLLRVSSRLLSSSVQALEALNKTTESKSSTLGSPLSLIRKSSSRKISRSSSNITPRGSSSKGDSQSIITSSGSDSSSNIIQIDQPPNKELIESYVYSTNEFDAKQEDEQDIDDGVHSGKCVINKI